MKRYLNIALFILGSSYEQGLKKFMKQQVQDGDMRPTSMPSREDVPYKKQMYTR